MKRRNVVVQSSTTLEASQIAGGETEPPRTPVKSSKTSELKRLLDWDELEEWQKDNEYIWHGYVRSENSMAAVLRSLGFFHNESGNVYTHLLPSVAAALVLIFTTAISPPFILFGIGCVLCLGMSATFHTLKSHSLSIATFGNKLDYLGICILIAASMLAMVDIAFADLPKQHYLFVTITVTLGILCSVVSLMDKFRSREWRSTRASIFVLYGLSGVLPIAVGSLELGFNETAKRAGLPWLLSEAVFYIFGAFIYAVRFPEKLYPGKFDYIGHSHQVFHVFVVIAAYSHYRGLKSAQIYAEFMQRL